MLLLFMMERDLDSPKLLVWAVDAFEESTGPWRHAVGVITRLQSAGEWSVQPAHVLSPAELNLSAEFAGPWVAHYLPSARQAIDRLLAEAPLSNLRPAEILTQPAASTVKAADTLIQYADRIGARLIVVATHGRRGLRRWLLGSFAETLLLRSKVPVMIAGPHTRSEQGFKHILFPTDFGESSPQVFRQVVAMAKEFGARLTLYHAVPKPLEPVFQSGIYMIGTPWVPVHEYHSRMVTRRQHHIDAWVEWAIRQGVDADSVIRADAIDISDEILRLAHDREVGLIAMAAHNGPLAAALLGSVARQVVRAAECPVWVIHPETAIARDGASSDQRRAA
jgi:nucleotide-binding universal stress UspA family protein